MSDVGRRNRRKRRSRGRRRKRRSLIFEVKKDEEGKRGARVEGGGMNDAMSRWKRRKRRGIFIEENVRRRENRDERKVVDCVTLGGERRVEGRRGTCYFELRNEKRREKGEGNKERREEIWKQGKKVKEWVTKGRKRRKEVFETEDYDEEIIVKG